MEHQQRMMALFLGFGIVFIIIFRQFLWDRAIAIVYRYNARRAETDVNVTISPPSTVQERHQAQEK